MGATYTNLLYHAVFSTKNRVPLITPELKINLYPYIGGIIRGEGGTLLDINGVDDHVHLVMRLKPVLAVSPILKLAKGNSSKWVNESNFLAQRFEWQTGFAAFSVSESKLPTLLRYVRNQEAHHAKMTFKQELIMLLKRHKVEYDERYIFE